MGRRLLRLDARAGARARRAASPSATRRAAVARPCASRSPARRSRSTLTTDQRAAITGSSPPSTRGSASTCCSRARRAAARPRSISRRAPRRLERGLGTIVLVPEIALAPQTVGRFRQRFGDLVAIVHSSLGDAERRDERDRIARGEARIVVGARSAVFAPDARRRPDRRRRGARHRVQAGVGSPLRRAHRRREARGARGCRRGLRLGDAAARELGCACVARRSRPGSAPRCRPSGSSTCVARPGTRSRRRSSARWAASSESGGRAILLLNRRGVAPAIHCRACGVSRRCPQCDVALTLHRDDALHCHHCGRVEQVPKQCPECRLGRAGPHRRRDAAARDGARAPPPGARALPARRRRLARGPAPCARPLERFRDADRAVLVGTQMVAKGHHVPGVSLAAVVDADTGLSLPDFRSEERTFQLVTQLAGRSGRDAPGRVLVQTFQPDATPLRHAVNHDVAGFLAGELERREALGYPPYRHLVSILVAGPEREGAARGPAGAAGAPGWRSGRPARPGARAPAARPASCAPDREDDAAANRRPPRLGAPRLGCAHDASRRAHGRRRRRPAVACRKRRVDETLTATIREAMPLAAHWASRASRRTPSTSSCAAPGRPSTARPRGSSTAAT